MVSVSVSAAAAAEGMPAHMRDRGTADRSERRRVERCAADRQVIDAIGAHVGHLEGVTGSMEEGSLNLKLMFQVWEIRFESWLFNDFL
ncbi:hypothetical protein [Chitinimonas koreensis]|nr:hypothetical protein [Chitinimonas koreensis]QNM98550.1 hypothetical protein H9L41_10175 [Chitinimonas koreensis]